MLPKIDLWPAHAYKHTCTQLWRISLSRLFIYMKETDTQRGWHIQTPHTSRLE